MNRTAWSVTARDGLTTAGLLLASLAAGLASNGLRSHPLPLVYRNAQAQVESADLDILQFEAIVAGGQAAILDARPEPFFRLGHVPGALSLPREEFDDAYGRLQGRLEAFRDGLVVVYCSDAACNDSRRVQTHLLSLGFARVAVFPGGWDRWTGAGLPAEGARR